KRAPGTHIRKALRETEGRRHVTVRVRSFTRPRQSIEAHMTAGRYHLGLLKVPCTGFRERAPSQRHCDFGSGPRGYAEDADYIPKIKSFSIKQRTFLTGFLSRTRDDGLKMVASFA